MKSHSFILLSSFVVLLDCIFYFISFCVSPRQFLQKISFLLNMFNYTTSCIPGIWRIWYKQKCICLRCSIVQSLGCYMVYWYNKSKQQKKTRESRYIQLDMSKWVVIISIFLLRVCYFSSSVLEPIREWERCNKLSTSLLLKTCLII